MRSKIFPRLPELPISSLSSFLTPLIFFIFFFLFFALYAPLAQDFKFSASNQLEYYFNSGNNKDIFHDWFDFIGKYDIYQAGLRYEAHQPDDFGNTFQEFSYRYFQVTTKSFQIVAGNYYALFGRGLILRSYENRDLRLDNNLDGIKGNLNSGRFDLTVLAGSPRNGYRRVNDPLQGADGKMVVSKWLTLGGSFVRTDIANFGFVRLFGGNASFVFPHLDLYAEYARKDNPSGENVEKDGEGVYLTSSFYQTGFGLTLEYKDYRRFDFTNGTLVYNNPPSLTKEHHYTLLNRNAYILNLYDEKGIQAQAVLTPQDKLSLLANYSYTTDHQNRMIFSEIYGEAEYDYKNLATLKGGFSYMKNKQEVGLPYFLAPVFDFTYYLAEQNSIAFSLEHQWTSKYDGNLTYYDQIISLGFAHSPNISLTLTDERTTEWKTRAWSGKKNWLILSLDLALGEKHNLTMSVGSRRAGKVCSGGICTDRPALDGGEIKLLSRF